MPPAPNGEKISYGPTRVPGESGIVGSAAEPQISALLRPS
jgi:hypothetical protein